MSSENMNKPKPKLRLTLSLNRNKKKKEESNKTENESNLVQDYPQSNTNTTSTAKPAAPKPRIILRKPDRGKALPEGVTGGGSDSSSKSSNKPSQSSSKQTKTNSSSSGNTSPQPAVTKTTVKQNTKVDASSSNKAPKIKIPNTTIHLPLQNIKSLPLRNNKSKAAPTPMPPPALAIPPSLPSRPLPSTAANPATMTTAPVLAPASISVAPIDGSNGLTFQQRSQCLKVLLALRRRNTVSKLNCLKPSGPDFKTKIPLPVDLPSIQSKLQSPSATLKYNNVSEFVQETRRMVANTLRYFSVEPKHNNRVVAVSLLQDLEGLFLIFLKNETFPPLLYCWKQALEKLDIVLSIKNPSDGMQTAFYFLNPVSYYFQGSFPPRYLDLVSHPMDFGTIISKLIEGIYSSVIALAQDCRLVVDNCQKFYNGRPEGIVFLEQCTRLLQSLTQEIGLLVKNDEQFGDKTRPITITPIKMLRPKIEILLTILSELKSATYTSRVNKAILRAMEPFEKPVDLTTYPDYTQFVQNPMDLETIEKKVQAGIYEVPEDFEFDINLIFDNCEKYNVPKKNIHIMDMSKNGLRLFKKIYASYSKQLETGEAAPIKKRARSPAVSKSPVPGGAVKKAKVEAGSKVSTLQQPPKIIIKRKSNLETDEHDLSFARVPLTISVERFKLALGDVRESKDLQPWELAAHRFYKELLRHPWLSVSNPKYIFHIPVVCLFPELKNIYLTKIKVPMDLSTAENKLLKGRIYNNAQRFVEDVSLTFLNSLEFNRAGHDDGDSTSFSYYEASKHLLQYTRWLSLEHLAGFLDNEETSTSTANESGMITHWKLTHSEREKARKEMESLVMDVQMEKSHIQDHKFNFWELECEKLLKALRHQSDIRYMTYFIHTQYPADYTAFIAKPIDWNDCQRNLQNRMYNSIGACVEDIRLIFSNALKYNRRAQGTETVSGIAYNAATYMSAKLEAAIDRMLLTMSEKLTRETVESKITQRNRVVAAVAEEEKRIALGDQYKPEPVEPPKPEPEIIEIKESVKIIKVPKREYFEDPYEEEEAGNREHAQIEAIRRQKTLFLNQQIQKDVNINKMNEFGKTFYRNLLQAIEATARQKKKSTATLDQPPVKKTDQYEFLPEIIEASKLSIPTKKQKSAKKFVLSFSSKSKLVESKNIFDI